MALQSGTRLGPYEIRALLGAGGMGEVYQGRDTRLDRLVALKILPAHLAERPDLRERFEREAKATAMLNHPTSGSNSRLHTRRGQRVPDDGYEFRSVRC